MGASSWVSEALTSSSLVGCLPSLLGLAACAHAWSLPGARRAEKRAAPSSSAPSPSNRRVCRLVFEGQVSWRPVFFSSPLQWPSRLPTLFFCDTQLSTRAAGPPPLLFNEPCIHPGSHNTRALQLGGHNTIHSSSPGAGGALNAQRPSCPLAVQRCPIWWQRRGGPGPSLI